MELNFIRKSFGDFRSQISVIRQSQINFDQTFQRFPKEAVPSPISGVKLGKSYGNPVCAYTLVSKRVAVRRVFLGW
jgi:hypothetical protein